MLTAQLWLPRMELSRHKNWKKLSRYMGHGKETKLYHDLYTWLTVHHFLIRFISLPTWYTFIFLFTFTIFSYNFLYMFRTDWSIIRRIKLHVQPLAPLPRSLLSRAWPLVLTDSVSTNGHARDNSEWGKGARGCTCNLILLMIGQPVRNM